MTINEMLQLLDEELDFPRPQRPTRGQRIHALLNSLQQLINESNNTSAPRVFQEAFFTTVPGQQYADLPTANFGQPLFVEPETIVFGNYELRIVPFQNITHYDLGVGGFVGGGDGQTPDITVVAFQCIGEEGKAIRVHCRPTPQNAVRYKVHFKIGKYDAVLGTEPPLPQFHPLAVYQAAIGLIGKTEWIDGTKADWVQHRNELRADLAALIPQHRRDFENYKVMNYQARSSRRLAYGEEEGNANTGLPTFLI